jgi:hypothetical protein
MSEDVTLRRALAFREHLWLRMPPAMHVDCHPIGSPGILLCRRLLQRSYRCRNINLLVIAYALRPRLRSRLTPGGLTWPGKPWVFGERVSHSFSRYSLWHNLSSALQHSFRCTFTALTMLPYRLQQNVSATNSKLRCPA